MTMGDGRNDHRGLRDRMRIPKTAEIVAGHIRARIVRGELREGDSLPPEGQLLATLGISRPTLREAYRILEAEALISVARGSRTGARIHRPQAQSVSRHAGFVLQAQGATIGDLYEARLAIEPFAARRLAERRPPDAIVRLRDEVARLDRIIAAGRYVEFMLALDAFHRLLFELGGNRTLLLLITVLQDVVARYQVDLFPRRTLSDEAQRTRSALGIRSLAKLVTLIEAGDADGAEAHWRLHVANANQFWADAADAAIPVETLD